MRAARVPMYRAWPTVSTTGTNTGPTVIVSPTTLHRLTGQVLHEVTTDRKPRRIVDSWGRELAVLLHPSDPRLGVPGAR